MHPTPTIDPDQKTAPAPGKAPSCRKSAEAYAWQITDHVCRCCFGRVLMRETFDRRQIYRCSNCGMEREGRSEAAICCCGMKLKTGVDAGIRCEVAAEPTPEFPSEVVAVSVDQLKTAL